MTPDPITVQDTGDVAEVAALLAEKGWKSLPVVRGRRLVGVISRSDVMRLLAITDEEIAAQVAEDFASLGRDDWRVMVRDGVAVVTGAAQGREARLARAIAETAPGVRHVVVEQPAAPLEPEDPTAWGERLALRNLRRLPPHSS
jgi:CBS domain-containing protein